jgi:hypothetical protein
MTKAPRKNPREVLDETATSIKKLFLELENEQMDGRPITAAEIQTIARQLQGHVEDLLAASKSLRDEKPGR